MNYLVAYYRYSHRSKTYLLTKKIVDAAQAKQYLELNELKPWQFKLICIEPCK